MVHSGVRCIKIYRISNPLSFGSYFMLLTGSNLTASATEMVSGQVDGDPQRVPPGGKHTCFFDGNTTKVAVIVLSNKVFA